jgi:hypothetical protein
MSPTVSSENDTVESHIKTARVVSLGLGRR